ncbi:hypothetical protein OD754_10755 [Rhodobacter capsulatus]|uniref:hypothetical protein n=1 Tax=Rhodobacter capsulatus TaxID=1061 RepID=UPI002876C06B|nr:hypothetical protein [Rhodobacter capsulatus]MDS0927303.1 hypothetical protein [Rhodobacter capsulatus]UYE93260.1 hypothetical protein Jorvik_11 [Rhodobacter phage Jorvik]
MTAGPIPGLSLGISPSSSAYADTGLDNFGAHGGGYTGGVNIGSGAGDTWITGLVRDLAILVGVVLAARYAWGHLK